MNRVVVVVVVVVEDGVEQWLALSIARVFRFSNMDLTPVNIGHFQLRNIVACGTNDDVYCVFSPSSHNLASPILSWSSFSGVYRLDLIAAKETLGVYNDSREPPFSSEITALTADGNVVAAGGMDGNFAVNRLANGPQPFL